MKNNSKLVQLNTRLPSDIYKRLCNYVQEQQISKEYFIRIIVEGFLKEVEKIKDEPKTDNNDLKPLTSPV